MRRYIAGLSLRAEFTIVILVAFGWFICASLSTLFSPSVNSRIAEADLRTLLVHELIVLAGLVVFLRIRGWTAESFGFRPNVRDTLVGLGLAIAGYFAYAIEWLILANIPALVEQAAGRESNLVAPGLSIATIIAVSIVNPIYEELLVSGYIISSLKGQASVSTAVNVSVVIRLLYHLYQGPLGVIGSVPFGLVMAYWYAYTGRLWPLIIAHASFDLSGLWAYADW